MSTIPATSFLSLHALQSAHRDNLEQIYRATAPVPWERAVWRGHFLCMVDSAGARNLALKWMSEIGFGKTPFWIDNERRLWCFGTPEIGVGRYSASAGASRWRDTQAVRLEYHVSKLPGLIRRELYDEVKPLSPDLCLGIGGINAERGRGDLFFFALTREPG